MAGTRDSRPVYSTDGGRLCPQCQRQLVKCVCGSARPLAAGDGVVRIRRETKGRGGKAVTVIAGIPEHLDTLKTLCKQLKKRCGVGGAVKGGQILGKCPPSFNDSNPHMQGGGRMIPTTSWEGAWHAVAQWLGIEEGKMDDVFPNLRNFDSSSIITAASMFKAL